MKKAILLTAALLAVCAGSAFAQAPGVNLSWDDCSASTAGGLNKTSTCLSNSEGQKNCNGSYVLPADADALAGNDIVMDIITNSGSLPCWWNFTVAPRTAGFGMNFGTPCAQAFDYWGSVGTPAGGPGAFLMPTNAVPRVRIKAVVAIDANVAAPVPASTGEIYSYTFNLKHGATVGACTGCLTSACFVLNLIRVTQVGFPYFELTTASSRNFVLWQGGAVAPPGCPLAVPTQNKTWGSVKALYR
jgi:hypothetical protein